MPKLSALLCLVLVLSVKPSQAQDDASELSPETIAIDICRWLSINARDMMIKRQDEEPMSEVLPFALERLANFPDGVEGATGEFLNNLAYVAGQEAGGFLSDFQNKLKPLFTEMVKGVYDVPTFSASANKRNAISTVENESFEACFESFAGEIGLSETSPDSN